MNIIFLVVDALRYDRCGFSGYSRDTTPFLDEFAEKFQSFENAYSSSSHTREGVPGLLTGEMPFKSVNDDYELVEKTLAQELKKQGFSTAAFHSNVFLSKAYGYSNGFDEFYDSLNFSGSKVGALGQKFIQKIRGKNYYTRGEDINEMALKWWEKTDGDKFMWLQYMDVHGPYEPKEAYQEWASWNDRKKVQQLYEKMANGDPNNVSKEESSYASDLYDCEIKYVDQVIRNLLEKISGGNIDKLDDTVVIITSDHGEAFGEKGYYGHPRELDDILLHVPLLTNLGGKNVSDPVSLCDLVPTVLNKVTDQVFESSLTGSREKEAVMSQARAENTDLRKWSLTDGENRATLEKDSSSLVRENGDKGLLDQLKERV